MTQTTYHDQADTTGANYAVTVRLKASPYAVYEAVSTAPGIQGWWSANTAAAQNGDITVRFSGDNFQTFRLIDCVPNEHVGWEWLAQYFPVEGTSETDEWVGTRVSFAIHANDDGSSTLVFTHIGLTPHLACYNLCNAGWGRQMESLKRYLEQGTGTPYTGPA